MFNVIISGKAGDFTAILIDAKSGKQFLKIERDDRASLIVEIEDLTTDL
jgi:hypothetical protein